MDEIQGHPYWRATYDKSGHLVGDDPSGDIKAADVEHLFVFAHGWNNSTGSAEDLFQSMFGSMAEAAQSHPTLGKIGFVGVFWPSIWFPEPSAAQSPSVAKASVAGHPGQADAAVTGAAIAASLKDSYPGQGAALDSLGKLIDDGLAAAKAGDVSDAVQSANVEQFHTQLRGLVSNATTAELDNGESALVDADNGQQAYKTLADTMGSAPPGGDEESLGDVFGKVWSGAKSAMRVASYLEMKTRAGNIGHAGLGPMLESLHAGSPQLKVHLVGHSFGARLVSYALSGTGTSEQSPVASVTLLQGAFSHWAFAQADQMPFGVAGPLCNVRDRVSGPVLSTFSQHDWAVGIWYPKASFMADQMVESTEAASKWGGMGSDGAQSVPGPGAALMLEESGHPYQLQAGEFYRFDSNSVIKDTTQSSFAGAHSDIRHAQVAWLPVCAAAGL
ncbi:MAG TPA: hypothetical protein VH085_01200 [Nocardioides sp.]|nr:hypothetical protein [Nocardioides sp.]